MDVENQGGALRLYNCVHTDVSWWEYYFWSLNSLIYKANILKIYD